MKHVLIVGGGITGLMTALKLYKTYKVTVVDAGPHPKDNNHRFGATYSGLDARHISFTETAPWTAKHRYDLIVTPSSDNGWLCIPKNDLTTIEKKWIEEFQKVAKDESSHGTNTTAVVALNKQGILEWEKLDTEYDFIKPVTQAKTMSIICRNAPDLMSEYNSECALDDRCKLYERGKLPDALAPLNKRLKDIGDIGYFTLYGTAYYSKTLCLSVIEFLKSQGVEFVWNHVVSDSEEFKSDIVAWCSGMSASTAERLRTYNISLCGVIGCWVRIDNPGITEPCKIYGAEPVNYINITPQKDSLLISGGYGFVGTRSYDEAVPLAYPIMDSLIKEVKNWFPSSEILEKAYCIRPAIPSGMPTLEMHKLNNNRPVLVAVGHAAGGFTQAPNTANAIKKKVDDLQ